MPDHRSECRLRPWDFDLQPDSFASETDMPPMPTPTATQTPTQTPTPAKVRSGSGLSVRGTQLPPTPPPIAPENLSLSELRELANAALRKENS